MGFTCVPGRVEAGVRQAGASGHPLTGPGGDKPVPGSGVLCCARWEGTHQSPDTADVTRTPAVCSPVLLAWMCLVPSRSLAGSVEPKGGEI